jgi:hypothetical protein
MTNMTSIRRNTTRKTDDIGTPRTQRERRSHHHRQIEKEAKKSPHPKLTRMNLQKRNRREIMKKMPN